MGVRFLQSSKILITHYLFTQWGDKTAWFVSSDGQKWITHNGQSYGTRWNNGDVIGCGLDLNTGEIHLSRNGTAFPGKFAFDMVKRGVGTLSSPTNFSSSCYTLIDPCRCW